MPQGIYLELIVSLVLLWLVFSIPMKNARLRYLYSSGLILVLLLALRSASFGNIDMLRYAAHYDAIGHTSSFFNAIMYKRGQDAVFWGVAFILNKLGCSFQFFTSIIAVFCISCYLFYVKRYSSSLLLSHFILLGTGCYTFLFYGLRQAIALSIILLCVDSYLNKKTIKAYLLLLLAFLFHWSAVVVLPILIVGNRPFNSTFVIVYFILLVFLFFFSTQIGYFITMVAREEYEDTYESTGTIGGLAILYLLFLFWYVFIYRKKIHSDRYLSFLMHSLSFLCMIQLCSSYAYSFTRLNYYYAFLALTIAVPNSFSLESIQLVFHHNDAKLIHRVSSAILLVLMVYLFSKMIHVNDLDDYVFFWETIG